MSICKTSRRRGARLALLLSTAGLVGAALLAPQAAMAQSVGPFAKFDGNWRGSGTVVATDGARERITCRASYSIPPSGAAVSQSLVCASDSYRFEVQTDAVVEGGHNVQGKWQEATRHAIGDLTGEVSDGRFHGTVEGTGFTAEISIKMTGAKQAVTITPHGGDVGKVDILLSRGV
jgi:hypothetical protein